jgi:acyl phosphate:glycerol-3-phosphate acyltransferase
VSGALALLPGSPGMAAAVLAGSYLLGSISWSYLIVRALQGRDVRTVGSGNAGATNVLRAAGKGPGIAVLLLDLGKGVTAVLAARALDGRPAVVGGAAVAVVLGHVFPLFLGFRGGKGVATAAGALGALSPPAMALTLAVFLGVAFWKRYVSLGSIAAACSFPFLLLLCRQLGWVEEGGETALFAAGLAIAALVLFKHRGNLQRLRARTEPRVGERRSPASEGGPEAEPEGEQAG